MKFKDYCHPTEEELRTCAADPSSVLPSPAWDLILSWGMEGGLFRVCVDLADDNDNPTRSFFREVLYQWVEGIVKKIEFRAYRSIYDGWLGTLKGLKDPAIKRWRHQARLIVQSVQPFDRERWRAECFPD